jgi:hypothetical protein
METLPKRYHHQVDELLDRALHSPFPEVRDALLQVAIICEHLADDIDKDDRSR